MSQAASFFQQCVVSLHGLLPCSLPLVCSSVRNEFLSVGKAGEHRIISFSEACKFLIGLPWRKMADLQETIVYMSLLRGRRVEKGLPWLQCLCSVLRLQPVKLLFLSNSSARSLEIISIMCGSSMQVQAGGKRAKLHVMSGNVRFQITQKEKASGPG